MKLGLTVLQLKWVDAAATFNSIFHTLMITIFNNVNAMPSVIFCLFNPVPLLAYPQLNASHSLALPVTSVF